jgi:arylsulfatase A-like enzyme
MKRRIYFILKIIGIQCVCAVVFALIEHLTTDYDMFFPKVSVNPSIEFSLLAFSYFIFLMVLFPGLIIIYLISKRTKMNFLWKTGTFKTKLLSYNILLFVYFFIITDIIEKIFKQSLVLSVVITLSIFIILLFIFYLFNKIISYSGKLKFRLDYLLVPLYIVAFLIITIGPLYKWSLFREFKDPGNIYSENPSIILISIDTLRKDHLPVYGYGGVSTPNLNRLAKDSMVFDNCFSTSPWTLPSMASMLTGNYPTVHNCGLSKKVRINSSLDTIQSILKKQKYTNLAFIGNPILAERLGYSEDFDYFFIYHQRYREFFPPKVCDTYDNFLKLFGWFVPLDRRDTTGWVEKEVLYNLPQVKERPIFMWIHYLDPHSPYTPPERFLPGTSGWIEEDLKEKELDFNEGLINMIRHYDWEIDYVDYSIGNIFSQLKEMDIFNDSLIIITADHGEEFIEHGCLGHGQSQYQDQTRIPLIIKPPAGFDYKRGQFKSYCSLIDIPRTILSFLDIEDDYSFSGKNLFQIVKEEGLIKEEIAEETGIDKGRDMLTEFIAYKFRPGKIESEDQKSIYSDNYHLIYDFMDSSVQLYNLQRDPYEQKDISDEMPELTSILKQKLIKMYKDNLQIMDKIGGPEIINLSEQEVEALRGMGYIIY